MKGILIENLKKKKIKAIIFLLVIVGVTLSYLVTKALVPTLMLKGPKEEVKANSKDEIVVPVTLSKLPEGIYPAASVSIKFDSNKLEFVSLASGTMETYNDYDKKGESKATFKVPNWTYNAKLANEEGEIKAMYLDTTVGKNAYNKDGFKKDEKDMPFKLIFKLKSSANPKDNIKIELNEAVFATETGDKDKSTLSTKKGYGDLKVKNTVIKVV
ncbi:cohesin domain-containing protein [Clostridium massiliamazoniense]|uniref:cohesin domain-containing protein n=1 Tax=Clostridium massiliamazoniense TaxID=1347366 RepID=UPI0006D7899A|nr:cohesin domain-containing protein [Clostridium massiliamazoniense]